MILLFGLICPCKKLRQEKAVDVCHFAQGGDTFPLGTTSLLEGSSGLQEAYTKACPNSAKLPQHVGAMLIRLRRIYFSKHFCPYFGL